MHRPNRDGRDAERRANEEPLLGGWAGHRPDPLVLFFIYPRLLGPTWVSPSRSTANET